MNKQKFNRKRGPPHLQERTPAPPTSVMQAMQMLMGTGYLTLGIEPTTGAPCFLIGKQIGAEHNTRRPS